MEEYMANGARLGWLLDPSTRQAHIYRPSAPPEIIDNPASLSADPELPRLHTRPDAYMGAGVSRLIVIHGTATSP